MKKPLLVLLALLPLAIIAQTPTFLEKKLINYVNKFNYWDDKSEEWIAAQVFHHDSLQGETNEAEKKLHEKWKAQQFSPHDSIDKYAILFDSCFVQDILSIGATFYYPFKELKKEWNMYILQSKDGAFRIYSYDNWLGGTMRSYTSIYQYKQNGKIRAKKIDDSQDGALSNQGGLYTNLWTLNNNGKYYYIINRHYQSSSYHYYDVVQVLAIGDKGIEDTIKLFKTTSGMHNSIGYEWNATGQFRSKDGVGYDNHIEYNKATKTIKIPLVYENGYVTKRFIYYRFNGSFFEKVKL